MMKKILAILILVLSFSWAHGQLLNGRTYTPFNNYYKWRGGAFDSVLLLPNVTATAGLRPGAIRYNPADSSVYRWTGSQWLVIAGSGGSGSTFTSGLTETAGVVTWGGNLTQNTSIYGNGNAINLFSNDGAGANETALILQSGISRFFDISSYRFNTEPEAKIVGDSAQGLRLYGYSTTNYLQVKDSIYSKGLPTTTDTADHSIYVINKTTGAHLRYTGAWPTGTSTDNLDSVVRRGATTTDSISINGNLGNAVRLTWIAAGPDKLGSNYPDTSGNLAVGGIINGDTVMANSKGLIDFGTVSGGGGGVQWTGVDSTFAYQQARNGYHENADFGGAFGTTGLTSIAGTKYTFTSTGIGAGITLPTTADSSFGHIIQTTGTATNGLNSLWHGYGAALQTWINLDADAVWFTARVKIETHSVSGQTFDYRIGLSAAIATQGTLVDAVSFVYDPQGNYTGSSASNNWQVVSSASSTRSWHTTSTVVSNGWTTLQIRATNNNVQFFINGTLVHTITTNIPTVLLSPVSQLWKRTGTTARTVLLDYITIDKTYSTPR